MHGKLTVVVKARLVDMLLCLHLLFSCVAARADVTLTIAELVRIFVEGSGSTVLHGCLFDSLLSCFGLS